VKIVLDSSVLIAAHITRAGVCAELLEDVLMQHQLFTSGFIFDDAVRKLREKFEFPEAAVQSIANFIAHAASQIQPAAVAADVCRNPEDIPTLGTAVAAGAKMLITVDKDLLAVGEYLGIVIVKPGAFWKLANR
jgi:putative PIN family toxin of toxin-antitoxin system